MKLLFAMLLALSSVAAVGEDKDIVIGTYATKDGEVTLFNVRAGCIDEPGLYASKVPPGKEKWQYVIGCWHKLDHDRLVVNFRDGTRLIMDRESLLPRRAPGPRITL